MKLWMKLLLSFTVTSLIIVVLGIFSVLNLNRMADADRELYRRATVPMKDLISITEHFQKVRIVVKEIALAEDVSTIQPKLKTFDELRLEIDEHMKNVEDSILSKSGLQILENYKKVRNEYNTVVMRKKFLRSANFLKQTSIRRQ